MTLKAQNLYFGTIRTIPSQKTANDLVGYQSQIDLIAQEWDNSGNSISLRPTHRSEFLDVNMQGGLQGPERTYLGRYLHTCSLQEAGSLSLGQYQTAKRAAEITSSHNPEFDWEVELDPALESLHQKLRDSFGAVFITGPSNGGKSSLAKFISRIMGGVMVDGDDYHSQWATTTINNGGILNSDYRNSYWLPQQVTINNAVYRSGAMPVAVCSALNPAIMHTFEDSLDRKPIEICVSTSTVDAMKKRSWERVHTQGGHEFVPDECEAFLEDQFDQHQRNKTSIEERSNALEINSEGPMNTTRANAIAFIAKQARLTSAEIALLM